MWGSSLILIMLNSEIERIWVIGKSRREAQQAKEELEEEREDTTNPLKQTMGDILRISTG